MKNDIEIHYVATSKRNEYKNWKKNHKKVNKKSLRAEILIIICSNKNSPFSNLVILSPTIYLELISCFDL
jgi:hypothetical protein